jgi:hypothetical protein
MKNRDTNTYCLALEKLKELIETDMNNNDEEDDYVWKIEKVHCDMEYAIITSCKRVFGRDVQIKLCFFHFADALRRKISSSGLTRLIRTSDNIRKSYLQIKYLSFIPPQ